MKKFLLLPAVLVLAGITTVYAQDIKTLKKTIELKVPRRGGANGAQVAWHPIQKKYYAAMAGNANFSLAVYNETGSLLSDSMLAALFDVRGLWYNPTAKALQMNGYDQAGWAQYMLDSKGIPYDAEILLEGMHQPEVQQAGAYNPREKMLYFLSEDGSIEKYDSEKGQYLELIGLALGKTKESDTDKSFSASNYDRIGDYNSSTPVYTGVPGAEIGLWNFYKGQIELYSLQSGYMTRKLQLPSDAPVNTILNFSYCNGTYWLFDKTARSWKGYK